MSWENSGGLSPTHWPRLVGGWGAVTGLGFRGWEHILNRTLDEIVQFGGFGMVKDSYARRRGLQDRRVDCSKRLLLPKLLQFLSGQVEFELPVTQAPEKAEPKGSALGGCGMEDSLVMLSIWV